MNKKFLIATHGELAAGLQSSLQLLAGKGGDVKVINAYMTDEDYTPVVEEFVASVGPSEQAVIFTDLFGGSVNQKVVSKVLEAKAEHIFVVTNANLPAVLAIMLSAEEVFTEESIEQALSEAQVMLVKKPKVDDVDEDSFF